VSEDTFSLLDKIKPEQRANYLASGLAVVAVASGAYFILRPVETIILAALLAVGITAAAVVAFCAVLIVQQRARLHEAEERFIRDWEALPPEAQFVALLCAKHRRQMFWASDEFAPLTVLCRSGFVSGQINTAREWRGELLELFKFDDLLWLWLRENQEPFWKTLDAIDAPNLKAVLGHYEDSLLRWQVMI
jgi:hypothetical protein